MTRPHDLLAAVAGGADPGPFALVRREGADHLELFTGRVRSAERLADLPLPAAAPGPHTLALVPYRQVAERGFACVDDGVPLEYLVIDGHRRIDLADALAALPDAPVVTTGAGFDVGDEEYARTVGRVLADEIGRGEGANFVIHRTMRATVQGSPLVAALAALRRLLLRERGAYWTFVVHTGTRILVGASPERHVSVDDGLIMMNPISGTFRHTGAAADRAELLRFLTDPKEIDELYMVLDEEVSTVVDCLVESVQAYLLWVAFIGSGSLPSGWAARWARCVAGRRRAGSGLAGCRRGLAVDEWVSEVGGGMNRAARSSWR